MNRKSQSSIFPGLSWEIDVLGDAPWVIAEIGANHNGDPDIARQMVDAIAETGAKLVKFQLYTADELVADTDIPVNWGPPGREVSETVGEMFSRISLPRENFPEIFSYCRDKGLVPFATPFSEDGVDFLESLDVPFYKVASSDVTHLDLLKKIALTGKPVILSVGKSTLADVDEAVTCLRINNCKDLALLHCVASYPSPMNEMNLRTITLLKSIYPNCIIGFSDHSIGITAPLAAVALGAHIIEKHVTLDQNMVGPDHWFSLNMQQLKDLVEGVNDVHLAMGKAQKSILHCERRGHKIATRSLISAEDLNSGHVIEKENIKIVRPGTGIRPKHLQDVIGMKLTTSVRKNQPLTWDLFKPR